MRPMTCSLLMLEAAVQGMMGYAMHIDMIQDGQLPDVKGRFRHNLDDASCCGILLQDMPQKGVNEKSQRELIYAFPCR